MSKRKGKKEKLKPLSDATPEELRQAMMVSSYWLADKLEGHTEKGAFSEANLGDEARLYFTRYAYMTVKDPNCKWKWKEDVKLSTLLINVMRSEMGHVLREYIENGEPDLIVASNMDASACPATGGDDEWGDANGVLEIGPEVQRQGFLVETEMEMLEELKREESMRDQGMSAARAAAKVTGDRMLEQYVELVFELPDYRSISKKLKITLTEVKALEAKMIAIFAVK